MKIAYILGTFPSISETFILREILALREHGIEVTIFALARPPSPARVHAGALPLLADVQYRPALLAVNALAGQLYCVWHTPLLHLRLALGVVRRCGPRPRCLARALRNLMIAGVFAREAQRRGIAHVHAHFAFMPADVAQLMAALLGGSFSVSAHARDIYTQDDAALAARLAKAAFVAVCTETGRHYLRRHCPGLASEKLLLVHHGLALRDFVPGTLQGAVILAVGRLEPKKGFATLLDACARLAARGIAFTCQIVGDGPQRAALQAQIAGDASLRDRVQLTGALTQEELHGLYAAASVFVLPSVVTPDGDRDGLPNAVLEAMAMKLPVVSTRASAASEVVRHGETGFLVPPGDALTLAGCLADLLEDPLLRQRLGNAGHKRVCADFDIARTVAPLAARFQAGAVR